MNYSIYETDQFLEWLDSQSIKLRNQVLHRVLRIKDEGYFGHHKYLESEDIWGAQI